MKKVFLFLIIASISNTAFSNSFEFEFNTGVENVLGVDGMEKPMELIPDILEKVRPIKAEDYDFKEFNTEEKLFDLSKLPNVNKKLMALALTKFAYDNRRYNLYSTASIKEKTYGFGANIRIDNDKLLKQGFRRISLGAGIDNKYIKGNISYHSVVNKNKYEGIDKYYEQKEYDNHDVSYNLRVNSFLDEVANPALSIEGINKYAEIIPSIDINKNGVYFSIGPKFYSLKEDINLEEELTPLIYTAPGYEKIEYLKDWTKKEIKPEKSYSNAFNEKISVEDATVSGYKGTHRLIGQPSGSLFGESLASLAINSLVSSIKENEKDKNIESYKILLELADSNANAIKVNRNKDALNKLKPQMPHMQKYLLETLKKELLEKIEYDNDKISKTHLLNILPNEPKLLLALIASKATDDEIKVNEDNKNMVLKERSFLDDFTFYYLKKLKDRHIILDTHKDPDKLKRIKTYMATLRDPNTIYNNGGDLLSLFYFHDSEKGYNTRLLKKEVRDWKNEIRQINNKKQSYRPGIEAKIGYRFDGLTLGSKLNLFDKTIIKGEELLFTKDYNSLNFSMNYSKNNLEISSLTNILIANNYLKTNNLKLKYNNVDYEFKNSINYTIKTNKKLNIGLGLDHLGYASYVDPVSIFKNDEEYTISVLKRDDKQNPINKKSNNAVIVKNTTEVNLKNEVNKKLQRDKRQHEAFISEKAPLKASWYNIYNIVTPKIKLDFVPNNNISISNELKVPVAIKGKEFSGVNVIYNINLKYMYK